MTIQEFAQRVQEGEQAGLRKAGLTCEANMNNAITTIHEGRKWRRVDVGRSGRYMINQAGEIFGIKGYGVPHLGHRFGTLDDPAERCFRGRWG